MAESFAPYSPQWWHSRLIVALGAKQERYDLLDRYHRSDAPLPPGPSTKGTTSSQTRFGREAVDAFEVMRKISRVNWADMIVEALIERMKVLGFSTGAGGTTASDVAAWAIWQANDLDTSMPQLLRTKGALGEAYTIVGPIDTHIGAPRVTCEDPRQVVVEVDPVDRRRVLAALKVFGDDASGVDRSYLYLPGIDEGPAQLYRGARLRDRNVKSLQFDAKGWDWAEPEDLPTTAVPVTWFPNRADLYGRVLGEFEHVLDDLNRISMLVLQRMQVAMLQAFRQRALKGDLPEFDETGKKIDYDSIFSSDPAAMWLLPNGVEMWESSGVDLTPILESVKADVRELAGRTRTPLYYLFPNEGGSAEGAVTQREGLIFRASSRITETDGPIEATMALALEAAGIEAPTDMETVWSRPDLATLAERYDAAAKSRAAGLPERYIWRVILQMSPQDIERAEQDAAKAAAQPTAVAAV